MRYQRYLKLRTQRLALLFKSIGLTALFPVFILNVFIPLISILIYRKHGVGEELEFQIETMTLIFVPFCSGWWNIFILRNFFENGSEVLYVNSDKSKLLDSILVFSIYILNVFFLYCFISFLLNGFIFNFIAIFCVCCFIFGFLYFIENLTRSMTITLMANILYVFINILSAERVSFFPLYYNYGSTLDLEFALLSFCFIATGVFFTFIGAKLKKLPQFFV